MAKVVVENVCKSYRDLGAAKAQSDRPERGKSNQSLKIAKSSSVNVLQNINFTVEDGEFLVLVGPSGCGKSTLLRLIAGLEELTTGKLWIGDRAVNQLPPKARDIAMVFQNYALYPHLNIYDNIAFGLRRSEKLSMSGTVDNLLVGMTRSLPKSLRYRSPKEKVIGDRVTYVASLLQIESLLNRLPKELSGGQKQRVALGRAIARNPQVFLMDEPLSNLDAKLRTQTRAQIVKLQRQLGTTTIYVTHDQTEAMTMGDRIAVINGGEIQQIAAPLEIYQQPINRFVAEFIGSPPMNFLPVEIQAPLTLVHRQFKLNLPSSWQKYLQHYRGRSLVWGIRPQHLHLGVEAESSILVTVDLVEALGNETYIFAHLTTDNNTTLTVSLPPDRAIAVGDSVWLAVDLGNIHLFAVDSGQSIIYS
ncbi:MAG: ABC transporter ATP-binding protein [Pleurocapsa sp.]